MTAKISAADLENAILEYVGGESSQVVSSRWHTSEKTLTDELKRRGLFRNKAERYAIIGDKAGSSRRAKTFFPVAEIASRYIAGESENALASAFGTVRNVIRSRLIEAGVTIRGNTEANQLLAAQTPLEEHHRRIKIAHAAVIGSTRSFVELCDRARGKQLSAAHATDEERQFARWLNERGVETTLQKAIGPYNCDIAAHPVAVEIFGGNFHAYGRHIARFAERSHYIFNEGWSLLFVWCNKRGGPVTPAAADYAVAFIDEIRRDPSFVGKYRMIWGNGQVIPPLSEYVENKAIIKAFASANNLRC